jgi:hypothetical protein
MSRKIRELIQEIINDWNKEAILEHWKKIAKFSNSFLNGINILYISSILIYSLDAIISYLYTHGEERRLLLEIHYSFNYLNSPNYEIIIIIQIIQAICICAVETLSNHLLITCVRTISCRLYKN